MEQRTYITRSWRTTTLFLIGAIVPLSISILFVAPVTKFHAWVEDSMGSLFTWIVAVFSLVPAAILLRWSVAAGGFARCPACGALLRGLKMKSNDGVLCSQCRTYSEGSDGMLWRTDENRVADKPIFSSYLPEGPIFPDGCCVCGRAQARLEKISCTVGSTDSSYDLSRHRVSAYVPHCAEHADGARLGSLGQDPYIEFR